MHVHPGCPVGGAPHLVTIDFRRRGRSRAVFTLRRSTDHVDVVSQHHRTVEVARAEMIGNRKGIARRLPLVGGLYGYPLGSVVVNLGEGRLDPEPGGMQAGRIEPLRRDSPHRPCFPHR